MTVAMPYPGYPYGYNPFNVEALNRSIGGDAPPDLKETFNVGPIDPPPRPIEEMDDDDERAVYASNRWPDEVCPALRPALEAHYRSMAGLADAPDGRLRGRARPARTRWFAPFIDRHGSALRVAHYPALDRAPAAGSAAGRRPHRLRHADDPRDRRPSLGCRCRSPDGTWIDVGHVPGGLVVNLGDLMQRWTNDRWRSTMHRVVTPTPSPTPTTPVLSASDDATGNLKQTVRGVGRRLSVPFFHNANWDAEVVCLTAPGEAPRHPPVTAGRHLMAKFRSTVT